MSDTRRPIPLVDERSAPFWAASARHELALARCNRCGAFSHPPDSVCASCSSEDRRFTFVPVDGRGRLRTWTVVRQSFLPGFDVPFVLVDVELDAQQGLRMIGRLVDGTVDDLALELPMQVVFEDVAPGVAVPAFTVVERR
jgi:uncharacterized OB-fold protein